MRLSICRSPIRSTIRVYLVYKISYLLSFYLVCVFKFHGKAISSQNQDSLVSLRTNFSKTHFLIKFSKPKPKPSFFAQTKRHLMKFYFVWNVGNSRWDDDVFFFLLLLCRVLKKHRFEKIEKKRRNWRIKFPSGGVVNFSDVDSEWFWKVLIF